jgi:CcmD family protein
MLTFITAYLLVWFAVSAYLIRLGSQQRRLRRAMEALERKLQEKPIHKRAA